MSTQEPQTATEEKKEQKFPEAIAGRFVPRLSEKKTPFWADHYITFYIPTRHKDKSAIPIKLHQQLVLATMNFLLSELGGASLTEANGFYVEDKQLHQENVTLCKSFCKLDALETNNDQIITLANGLAIACDQDSLGVEIDGVLYFFQVSKYYKQLNKWHRDKGKKTYYEVYLETELAELQERKKVWDKNEKEWKSIAREG